MVEEFLSKLNNNEYISNYLYRNIKESNSNIIPKEFNIDEYNNKVLDKLYIDNKEYFDNMYKGIDDNIHLDEEQCKAILADEKYSLIIAGAGTGKTTTMSAKVKYLVDIKNVDPSKILVMSYTRKTTEELEKRIKIDFDIDAHITTFHSLGYEYIRNILKDKKCRIVDHNIRNEICLEYFKKIFKDKNKIKEIIENFYEIRQMKDKFLFSNLFLNNYMRFDDFDNLLDYIVEYKMKEAKYIGLTSKIEKWVNTQLLKAESIESLKGEYVKSAGEMVIANFLYKHGLDYAYEEVYDELLENNSIYKPDFTIDYGGEKIYIEYFGLNDNEYNSKRKKKIELHKNRNNKFIELDNYLTLEEDLDRELKKYNVKYNDLSNEEIWEHRLRLNPLSQVYPFINYLYESITARKESIDRENVKKVDDYLNSISNSDERKNKEIQKNYINEFYSFYNRKLFAGIDNIYYFEFSDLLYYSNLHLNKLMSDKLKFDYIIIDEYQDISKSKYDLVLNTSKRNDSKVYAVGDDWQSIYAFSGSRIEYIYDFEKYFKDAKSFKITKVYRNSKELIDYTSSFIMKNENQISKNLNSDIRIDKPIKFIGFEYNNPDNNEIAKLKEIVRDIHREKPNHSILILTRWNNKIKEILKDDDFIDDLGTKITFRTDNTVDIDGMTIHKSKGLTYDEVILFGLDDGFPDDRESYKWYENIYKNKKIDEDIEDAEERRVFYVALTRTKNSVYILFSKNKKYRSRFIDELFNIIEEQKKLQ